MARGIEEALATHQYINMFNAMQITVDASKHIPYQTVKCPPSESPQNSLPDTVVRVEVKLHDEATIDTPSQDDMSIPVYFSPDGYEDHEIHNQQPGQWQLDWLYGSEPYSPSTPGLILQDGCDQHVFEYKQHFSMHYNHTQQDNAQHNDCPSATSDMHLPKLEVQDAAMQDTFSSDHDSHDLTATAAPHDQQQKDLAYYLQHHDICHEVYCPDDEWSMYEESICASDGSVDDYKLAPPTPTWVAHSSNLATIATNVPVARGSNTCLYSNAAYGNLRTFSAGHSSYRASSGSSRYTSKELHRLQFPSLPPIRTSVEKPSKSRGLLSKMKRAVQSMFQGISLGKAAGQCFGRRVDVISDDGSSTGRSWGQQAPGLVQKLKLQ